MWFEHLWFFERLREDLLQVHSIPHGDERINPLIERDGDLVVLSPLGELMRGVVDQFTSSRLQDLLPPDSEIPPEQKKVIYEDGNSGKHRGLKEFCDRLCKVKYVKRIGSFYYNPDLPSRIVVRIPSGSEKDPGRLEVWYSEGTALTKLNVWTTAAGPRQLVAARTDLSSLLGAD